MAEFIKRENNTVYFDITIKNEDVKKAQTDVYNKNKKHFQVPGFRKGKVPRKIIENMYGKDVFAEDAMNELLPKAYEEAIEELELEPVDQPHIDIEEFDIDKDVVVHVDVEVKPEVKLGEYKGLEAEDVQYEVTEDMIDSELENQRQMNARLINIDDRPAKDGDKVNIDFEGSVDGENFDGGTAQGQDLELGSNTFIPGFEDQIAGHEVGDEFDVMVTFPEDYFQEELAGKEAKFKTTLNSISYEELPELDDEFIKDISDFDTVEEYREDIRKRKQEELENSAKAQKEANVLNKLLESVEIDVPNAMVEEAIDNQIQNYSQNMRNQGISLEDYLKMIGSTMEDFRENMRAEAEKSVKIGLAVEAVAEAEGFEVTDEELEQEVDEMVERYFGDDEEQQEKMKKYMMESNADGLRDNLRNRKAIDFLMEEAVFVEPKMVEEGEESEATEEEKEESTEETEE